MIKAIIFDCFGVLTTEGFDAFKDKYLKDSPANCSQANVIMDSLNTGQSSYDEFLEKLAALAQIDKAEAFAQLEQNSPNESLFAYIRTNLKPKYKIGLLSNAGNDWINEMFEPADVTLFDDIVLSYQFGMIKPNPAIFELAASRLGVQAAECVFVDDKQKHLAGASQAGMQPILYKDFEQMKTELEAVL